MTDALWKTRLALPQQVAVGERVQLRTLIAHPMESGFRPGQNGQPIARDIITDFACHYDNRTVFAARFFPAVAANPYLSFHFVATVSGVVRCIWTDQHGRTASAEHELRVI